MVRGRVAAPPRLPRGYSAEARDDGAQVGVAIWNVGMLGIGFSHVFWQLLCARLILGAGQAFSNPASYALIADYFPENKRAEANGLFACGVYLGGGIASLCLDMAETWGWRRTCYFIAFVGFALAAARGGRAEPKPVATTLREPKAAVAARRRRQRTPTPRKSSKTSLRVGSRARRCGVWIKEPPKGGAKRAADDAEPKATMTMRESLAEIFGNRVMIVLFVATSFRFMGGYAIATYRAPRGLRRVATPPRRRRGNSVETGRRGNSVATGPDVETPWRRDPTWKLRGDGSRRRDADRPPTNRGDARRVGTPGTSRRSTRPSTRATRLNIRTSTPTSWRRAAF